MKFSKERSLEFSDPFCPTVLVNYIDPTRSQNIFDDFLHYLEKTDRRRVNSYTYNRAWRARNSKQNPQDISLEIGNE